MSRESLRNLINAAEHSLWLRKELFNCKNYSELIIFANKNGFEIKEDDLIEESNAEKIEIWFNKSKISPLRSIF